MANLILLKLNAIHHLLLQLFYLKQPISIQECSSHLARGRSFSDSKVNQVRQQAKSSVSLPSDDGRIESDPIPEPKRSSLSSSLGFPSQGGYQFSYSELMGIIQFLTVYWKQMKSHLVQMDNNLGVFLFFFRSFR